MEPITLSKLMVIAALTILSIHILKVRKMEIDQLHNEEEQERQRESGAIITNFGDWYCWLHKVDKDSPASIKAEVADIIRHLGYEVPAFLLSDASLN